MALILRKFIEILGLGLLVFFILHSEDLRIGCLAPALPQAGDEALRRVLEWTQNNPWFTGLLTGLPFVFRRAAGRR